LEPPQCSSENWGNAGVGDINSDGVVNAADVTVLLGAWQ